MSLNDASGITIYTKHHKKKVLDTKKIGERRDGDRNETGMTQNTKESVKVSRNNPRI